MEQVKDFLSVPPGDEYFAAKIASGWKLASIIWERPEPPATSEKEETPFGLQVADDCHHLAENAIEKRALIRMMELIVKDTPLDVVAAELNSSGYRTRLGAPWSPASIFDMLPRLIEAGPKILVDAEYVARRHG